MCSAKVNNQHLCLFSCPIDPVDGLQHFAAASQKLLPLLRKQDSARVSGPYSASAGTTSAASPGTMGLRSSAAFGLDLRQQ